VALTLKTRDSAQGQLGGRLRQQADSSAGSIARLAGGINAGHDNLTILAEIRLFADESRLDELERGYGLARRPIP
jgi:hypothetical protein